MSDLQIEEATLEEAVAELSTLHDWLRWTTSQFASSSIFFGHGTSTNDVFPLERFCSICFILFFDSYYYC